jgi:hypothetical protein
VVESIHITFNAPALVILIAISAALGFFPGVLIERRWWKRQQRRASGNGPTLRLGTAQQPSEGGRLLRRVPVAPQTDDD